MFISVLPKWSTEIITPRLEAIVKVSAMFHGSNLTVVEVILLVEQKTPPQTDEQVQHFIDGIWGAGEEALRISNSGRKSNDRQFVLSSQYRADLTPGAFLSRRLSGR